MSVTNGVSKSQLAYLWVKERIANQEFAPGYRLVLGTIANQLDMSVVPVREAVRQLEAEGLVTFEYNVGARVAMVDDSQYRFEMEAISIVESAATALAARHLTVDDLRRARSLNEAMTASLTRFDPRAFSALNQEFHHVLYSRCTNPRLLEIVTTEWARLGHMRDSIFAFVPARAQESVTRARGHPRADRERRPAAGDRAGRAPAPHRDAHRVPRARAPGPASRSARALTMSTTRG